MSIVCSCLQVPSTNKYMEWSVYMDLWYEELEAVFGAKSLSDWKTVLGTL